MPRDTLPARQAKRHKRLAAGGIDDLRLRLWDAIEAASGLVADEVLSPDLRLRAVHAVTQAAASYTRVLDAAEFNARLVRLEEKLLP